jgi:hypothetical protein
VIIHFMIQSNKAKKKMEDIKLINEIKSMDTEKKHQVKQEVKKNTKESDTPLEEAIIVSQEKYQQDDEERNGLVKHKKRRESLQQGINLAQQIDTVFQKEHDEEEKNNQSLHNSSDDFLLSNENSSMAKYTRDIDHWSDDEEERKDDEFPTFSPRKAFAYLTERFATGVEEDDNDFGDRPFSHNHDDNQEEYQMYDENEDDDLFNLHLAKQTDPGFDNDKNEAEIDNDELNSYAAEIRANSLSNTYPILLDQSEYDEVPPFPIQERSRFDDGEEDSDEDIHLPPLQQQQRQSSKNC